jgi:hypothetical protein
LSGGRFYVSPLCFSDPDRIELAIDATGVNHRGEIIHELSVSERLAHTKIVEKMVKTMKEMENVLDIEGVEWPKSDILRSIDPIVLPIGEVNLVCDRLFIKEKQAYLKYRKT